MIPRYARNAPPDDVDNSAFGEVCPTVSLADSHAISGVRRTITAHAPMDLPAGRAYRPDIGADIVDNFLGACRTEFVDYCTAGFEATVFPPENAVFASGAGPGGGQIIEESLWHSELYFYEWFRNDRTTNWKWRVNRTWQPSLRISEPVNYCFHRFHFQYFHWLIDCLPRVWLLKNRGPEPKASKWVVGPLNTPMHVATLRLFDIPLEDCVWLEAPVVEFKQMIYSSFDFREPIKTRPSYNNGIHHRGWWPEYLKELRDRAVTKYAQPNVSRDLKLYITRDDSKHRLITNGPSVDALLHEYGFIRVTPGTLPFEEQVAIFSRARVIVGTHGAGLTNIIWAAPGAKVLEFMPCSLGDPGYRFLSQLCGHDYSCLFVRWFDDPRGVAYANIEVDMPTLRQALADLLG